MPQLYYSGISIKSGQVPSTQTDFPVLVSQTDNRFKTTGNGGHVANTNGYDIRPYSDSTLGTQLTYELERYNAATGEVIMWVKVSSLSSSTTPIYLGYGDTSLSTDASSTATWSNNFKSVYHQADGSSLNAKDSTGSFNGFASINITAGVGQIDGGSTGYDGSNDRYISLGDQRQDAVTVSTWAKATAFTNAYNAPVFANNITATGYYGIFVNSSGKLALYYDCSGGIVNYDGTGSHTLSSGTWYYLVATYSSSDGLTGYVNASSDGTASANGTIKTSAPISLYIGKDPTTVPRYWNGSVDETRIATVARPLDWITTEYNNQSAPSSFETLEAELEVVPISGLFRL